MSRTSESFGVQQVIESAWRDQAIWSETANRFKRELGKWRNVAAVAGVLGAILETCNGQVKTDTILSCK